MTLLKNLVLEDHPCYKLINRGVSALTDAEILCNIIGSLELSKKIFGSIDHDICKLSSMTVSDLMNISGIAEKKAVAIVSAFELSKRRMFREKVVLNRISSSKDAFDIFRTVLMDKPYEEFWIILMNRANRVIKFCNISEGGVTGTIVDPKKIFKVALDNFVTAIILGHNHPSGNLQPSEADIKITKKVVDGGKLLDIKILDHLIVGDDRYYSFTDEGLI